MKIKEDIIKWKEELKKCSEQNAKMMESAIALKDDVKSLANQVAILTKISEDMAAAMLSLIRQQIGD